MVLSQTWAFLYVWWPPIGYALACASGFHFRVRFLSGVCMFWVWCAYVFMIFPRLEKRYLFNYNHGKLSYCCYRGTSCVDLIRRKMLTTTFMKKYLWVCVVSLFCAPLFLTSQLYSSKMADTKMQSPFDLSQSPDCTLELFKPRED